MYKASWSRQKECRAELGLTDGGATDGVETTKSTETGNKATILE
jgi:hypothetical protein